MEIQQKITVNVDASTIYEAVRDHVMRELTASGILPEGTSSEDLSVVLGTDTEAVCEYTYMDTH